ncbi:MAG: PilN domain-containing protein [Candidatus Saccharimonadales bacterium]
MIQLNLLPDVKVKYIKAQRSKRMILLSAIVISGVSLGILVIVGSVVYGAQKVQLSYYDREIKKNSETLNKVSDLDKILTVQNQLNTLEGLHNNKPVTTRLFEFLPQITPNDVQISSLNLNFADPTMQFTGGAKTLESVNKFADTLKFTKFTVDDSTDQKPAFSEVVLVNFTRKDGQATYTITLKYNPEIFNSSNKKVTLVVPKITSTRSQTEQPTDLFKADSQQGQ